MIAHVTSAAAVGRKLTMAEAWAATHGKRWRLFGMSFLLGLAVVVAIALVAAVLLVGILAFDAPLGATVVVGVVLGLLLRGRLRLVLGPGARARRPDPDARAGRRLRGAAVAPSA